MNSSYVYIHKKKCGEIYYVGIGNEKNRRAHRNEGRNNLWTKIFNKHGKVVDILISNLSWENACKIEVFLISHYGRICDGTGTLANMTIGGEGANGVIRSEETKQKLRVISTGKPSPMKGKTFGEDVRERMSIARKGKAPWNKGKDYPRVRGGNNVKAKACINIQTGEIVSNATELAKILGYSRQGLCNKLTGFRINDTMWKYAN